MEHGQSMVSNSGAEVGGAFSWGTIKALVHRWRSTGVGQP